MAGVKRHKKAAAVIAVTIVLMMAASCAFAVPAAHGIYVDGKLVAADEKVIDGKLYVPVDEIGKALGASVSVDTDGSRADLTGGDMTAAVIERVGPSVVGIIGKIKESSQNYTPAGENLEFGTGVIYRKDGYIITNAHVVVDMENIVVVLQNSKAYQARLKVLDEKHDLAIVKIDKGGLKPAVFGDINAVTVGEPVIAIGTPLSFSFRNSATKGIVSGINRSADGENKFIQSDAAINGGNSGGPLVNLKGEVIGINSVKYAGIGVEGLNFSIPIDTVQYVIDQFNRFGKVRTPYLGVVFSESIAARYGLPTTEGLTITEVEANSPASRAGLLVEDVVYAVNGVRISAKLDYNEELKKYIPGDKVVFKVLRAGRDMDVKVTYGETN